MRWYILRTLLHKELLRHLAERGGLFLSLLLLAMSLLLSFGKGNQQAGPLAGDLQRVYVVRDQNDPAEAEVKAWFQTLQDQVPEDLKKALRFRLNTHPDFGNTPDGRLTFPENSGLIRVTSDPDTKGYRVVFWYPGDDNGLMAPFEAWFWKATSRHFLKETSIRDVRQHIEGSADIRSGIATALVLFQLFFTCIYLLPSMTCEERERGVLLAQALSPASPVEILIAKFLFYPVLGIGFAAAIGGIYNPRVLVLPYFWAVLFITAFGSLGIGLCIASLARTQRLASLGALCYMLVVALLLLICQQNGIGGLPWLFLEYHGPRMIHAALADNITIWRWFSLVGTTALSLGWAVLAVVLFRQRGWQ
jgi:hypothetical protein